MSAAWIVITTAHLDDYLVSDEMTALRATALRVAPAQADPFTNIMHDRANYVRARLKSRIRLSATAYAVPPELKTCTCVLIIEGMANRLPGIVLGEQFQSQVTRAYKDLDIAATGDLPISEPTDPVDQDTQVGGGIEIVTSETQVCSLTNLSGF
jgi:hypothetical protein